jgi:hypothetical protein
MASLSDFTFVKMKKYSLIIDIKKITLYFVVVIICACVLFDIRGRRKIYLTLKKWACVFLN